VRLDTLVDCAELAARLDDPDWRIFDCRFDLAAPGRGEQAHAETHLPDAFYAHLDRDLSNPITPQSGRHPLPDTDRLCDWLGRHGVSRDTQVIVYDDTGGTMAVRLWWLLRWLGHDRVAILDGGWQAWVQAGLPLQASPPGAVEAVTFEGSPDWRQVVTTDTLDRQLRDGSDVLQLMDARTAERFRGEAEPIDPVAGHIPGAMNLPLQDNLDQDGSFKSKEALRNLYNGALAGRHPDSVVAMCGSGVTACHNLLAMELAGLHGARLYAGSWSEWIRDPLRPVATGG
jgi:thiosulfate/3-mercaptopyruvate sulfurtransferase